MLFLRTPQNKWRRQTNYQANIKQTDALQGELYVIFESLSMLITAICVFLADSAKL